jgi:hypothetical protein
MARFPARALAALAAQASAAPYQIAVRRLAALMAVLRQPGFDRREARVDVRQALEERRHERDDRRRPLRVHDEDLLATHHERHPHLHGASLGSMPRLDDLRQLSQNLNGFVSAHLVFAALRSW